MPTMLSYFPIFLIWVQLRSFKYKDLGQVSHLFLVRKLELQQQLLKLVFEPTFLSIVFPFFHFQHFQHQFLLTFTYLPQLELMLFFKLQQQLLTMQLVLFWMPQQLFVLMLVIRRDLLSFMLMLFIWPPQQELQQLFLVSFYLVTLE